MYRSTLQTDQLEVCSYQRFCTADDDMFLSPIRQEVAVLDSSCQILSVLLPAEPTSRGGEGPQRDDKPVCSDRAVLVSSNWSRESVLG